MWIQIVILVATLSALLTLFTNSASAAQLTARSVTITTSKLSASSVTYTYGFTTPATTNIGSIALQACTTPLGTCTSPGGTITMNAGTEASRSGWTGSNTFVTGSAAGCTPAANLLCITRTAQSETLGARTLGWNTQTNPTAIGSYYIRITTYSDAAWVTSVDTGVVAYSITNQITVNARIAEILNFCVGTTAIDNATSTPGADCTAISGTTVDIGVLDAATPATNTTPVSTNGGSNTNGVVMVRTNAQSGVVISYFAEQNNSSGTLKVAGAACGSTLGGGVTTDQCINTPSGTDGNQATITAGTEAFGMTIAGTNCGSTLSYSCVLTSGTNKLKAVSPYIGATATSYGTTAGFAWKAGGTTVTIANSTTIVEDEALILKFAATPSITTPTGAYTVTSTYVATATY